MSSETEINFAEKSLFPPDLPYAKWIQFAAAGFNEPVSGILFSNTDKTCCGMPLGGLGTGCLDIETTGVLGFDSLFQPETSQFSYEVICLRNPF